MESFKAVWKWLDGKKRNFASLYWAVAIPSIFIIWPDDAPAAVEKAIAITGLFLTALGYGHAAQKKGGK